jgi:hypothetical protein
VPIFVRPTAEDLRQIADALAVPTDYEMAWDIAWLWAMVAQAALAAVADFLLIEEWSMRLSDYERDPFPLHE